MSQSTTQQSGGGVPSRTAAAKLSRPIGWTCVYRKLTRGWPRESRKELLNQEIYNGPIMEMSNVNTIMTDSGKLILRLKAPKQLQFQNGDKSWTNGLILEYYSTPEKPICTFRSNFAHFNAKNNIYKGEGNVLVKNIETGDELNTELLFWSPAEEKFYTDNFVTIISEGEVHTGKGLSANQDFSSYEILEPAGTIQIEEDAI